MLENSVSVELVLSKKDFMLHMRTLMPELSDKIGRSTVRVDEDQSDFHIYIGAPDMVSIKPALSSISKLLVLVSKVDSEVI